MFEEFLRSYFIKKHRTASIKLLSIIKLWESLIQFFFYYWSYLRCFFYYDYFSIL